MSGGDSIFILLEILGVGWRVRELFSFVKVLKAVSLYCSKNKTVIKEQYDLCIT